MKKLILLLVLLLTSTVLARPTDSQLSDQLGSWTGDGGTSQNDSVKASLDILHDWALANLGGGSGDIWYVDNNVDSSAGENWTTAVGTIDEAINLASANDVILVAAGHYEALTGADGVDADVKGLQIIGLGAGDNKPLLDFTNGAGEFVIGAINVAVKNIHFHANVDSTLKAIDVEAGATGYVIEDCLFTVETAGTDEFDNAIIVGDASDNGTIRNNVFRMLNGEAVSAIYLDHDADNTRIIGNEVFGDYSTACIVSDTAASLNITIKDNLLFNGINGGDAGLNTEPYIELLATTSGAIIDNRCICNVAEPEDAIVAADCHLIGNIYNETEADSGGYPIGGVVGQVRVITKSSVMTGTTDDLFDVQGGAIEIISFAGQVTTAMAGNPGDMSIEYDADAGAAYDGDFSTSVTVDTAGEGDWLRFSNAIDEGVLDLTANVGAGQSLHWFCPEGMIEQTLTSTGTGAVKWYMIYRILDPGTRVVAQ